MQPGGGFVQNVENPPGWLGESKGQSHPLMLPPGQGRERLTQCQVPEPNPLKGFELGFDAGLLGENIQSLFDGQSKDIDNGATVQLDPQGVPAIAQSAAGIARRVHIIQKLHVDDRFPRPLTDITPTAGHVEGKPAGPRPKRTGFPGCGKALTNPVEGFGDRRGI